VWRNWVVRRRADARPVGTVQATIGRRAGGWTAEIAWVVGVAWQGRGYASEAARALVAWLGRHDVQEIVAHIHPDHAASARVATWAGLRPPAARSTASRSGDLDRGRVSRLGAVDGS
jgi:RimJ/RimL family protein N-acetyltransferase